MKFRDHYQILGLAPTATADEIKAAYRKRARKLHPDVSRLPDAERRFSELAEAHAVLKDPARRSAHDAMRERGWRDGQEMPPPPPPAAKAGADDPMDRAADADFSEFFRAWSGHAGHDRSGFGGATVAERGDDLSISLPVTLEEAFLGSERQLSMQLPVRDDQGRWSMRERVILAKIPKGVEHGTRMRLRGQGHAGSTTALDGDLYLEVELVPHRLYRIDGRNLTLTVPITPWEAALGAQVVVPTLGGMVTATIPADTQGGATLRLKGRGLPGAPPGDQYLAMTIVMPRTSSPQAKELYRQLARESPDDPRAALRA